MRRILDIAAQQRLRCHQEEQIHLAGVNPSFSTTSFLEDSEGLTDCRPFGYSSRLTNTDTAPWSIWEVCCFMHDFSLFSSHTFGPDMSPAS